VERTLTTRTYSASRLRLAIAVGVISAMLAACSGGSSGPTPGLANPGASPPAGNLGTSNPPGNGGTTPTEAGFDFSFPAFVLPTNVPSTALVQVMNTYVPGDVPPFAIDVYAAPRTAASKPLVTVPYGQVSPAFDPTIDEHGDLSLSFYQQGSDANADEVMRQDESVKGGERFTMLLATSSITSTDPRRGVSLQTFFDVGNTVDSGNPTPQPGQAILIVDSLGLDAVWGDTTDQNYIKLGDECLPYIGGAPGSQVQPAGVGVGTWFQVKPGSGPLVAYTGALSQSATCSGKPASDPVTATFAAGDMDYLFLWSSDKTSLKSLFVPQLH
jgi:hypothetical protein